MNDSIGKSMGSSVLFGKYNLRNYLEETKLYLNRREKFYILVFVK